MPVSAHDVAAYILEKVGRVTTWKLQKLVYYSQAWSLVWNDAPLFNEEIQAWANGPVCPVLYDKHKGKFNVSGWQWGNARELTAKQRATIDPVLEFYGDKTSQWLSDLTHHERPWLEAREGVPLGARSSRVITWDAMAEYYGSL